MVPSIDFWDLRAREHTEHKVDWNVSTGRRFWSGECAVVQSNMSGCNLYSFLDHNQMIAITNLVQGLLPLIAPGGKRLSCISNNIGNVRLFRFLAAKR